MPALFKHKKYLEKTHYHVFNRGSRKGLLFRQERDYRYFLRLIIQLNKQFGIDVHIYPFCLMPNHYHFVLYQTSESALPQFMHKLGTRYGMYYKKRYPDHSGYVFEGRYKAEPLKTKSDLGRIVNYILSNPAKAGLKEWKFVGFIETL